MKRWIYLLLAVVMAFAATGCREEVPQETLDQNYDWKVSSGLTYGQMSADKLRITTASSGRADATGWDAWAETETGYYFFSVSTGKLHYADKANLDQWVLVCNQPGCSHTFMEMSCAANMHGNSFLLRNERLYFIMDSSYCKHLHNLEGRGYVLCSRALDGSDLRLEHVNEDAQIPNGGNSSDLLLPEGWLYNVITLNPDGGETATAYFVGEAGLQILVRDQYGPGEVGHAEAGTYYVVGSRFTHGDRIFRNDMLGSGLYRIVNGQVESINLPEGATESEGYLSGDVFRYLRENDGYYDFNVKTGEETKIAEPRLQNSFASILLPNCIIESSRFNKDASPNEESLMEIFDGESWRSVQLPEELRCVNQPGASAAFVGSDRIIFMTNSYSGDKVTYKIYQVLLDSEELVMELCGMFTSRS